MQIGHDPTDHVLIAGHGVAIGAVGAPSEFQYDREAVLQHALFTVFWSFAVCSRGIASHSVTSAHYARCGRLVALVIRASPDIGASGGAV